MSDNVKIKIHEVDKTTAGGRGQDATDIAFVPGFSTEIDAPTVPTLCTTIDEFEELFGKTPVSLTPSDIVPPYDNLKILAGEADRGYVYAKELLYQGMSVVYGNLGNSDTQLTTDVTVTLDEIVGTSGLVDNAEWGDNQLYIKSAVTGKLTATAGVIVNLAKDTNFSKRISLQVACENTSALNFVKVNNFILSGIEVDAQDYSEEQHKLTYTQNGNVIELIRTSADGTGDEYDVTLCFDVELAINAPYAVDKPYSFSIGSPTGSILELMYNGTAFTDMLKEIVDRNSYSIKYITSGGYPSIDSDFNNYFAADMIAAAKNRGDAVALIDGPINDTITNYGTSGSSYYEKMYSTLSTLGDAEYGACMYPWASYNCSKSIKLEGMNKAVIMPASFGYLMCVARAIKNNPNWLAIAGVSRGLVPGINYLVTKNGTISNSDAENMQPKYGSNNKDISINCITNIRPYGLTLWGNRTLMKVGKDGTVALNFLNTRNMISDIKKNLYSVSTQLMFEQNSDALWAKFKSKISPFLDKLKSGAGISDYKILKSDKKNDGTKVSNGELAAIIRIYPLYSIEYFDLTVELSDQDITVA